MLLRSLLVPLSLLAGALADRRFESNSLASCIDNSDFSASLFQVQFTPDDNTLSYTIDGVSQITGYVNVTFSVLAYGYTVYHSVINPCTDSALQGLCPMRSGASEWSSTFQISADSLSNIPNAVYYIPDIDLKVQAYINNTAGEAVACLAAELSNGKTVHQPGVAWAVAVVAGLSLVISAIASGLGHLNTAAHVSAFALSLFSYFQAQAIIAMTAVTVPPIVRAWTLNFQWSMGLISVGFLQTMATWYQRATGGTTVNLLGNLDNISVQVQKRSLGILPHLWRRTNSDMASAENPDVVVVRGIEKVGFLSEIDPTNIFFTGYVIFIAFIIIVTLGVIACKYLFEALISAGVMKSTRFQEFRSSWRTVLKGILYRIILIGFPQMVILCFWEFTRHDSGGEVVLAVFALLLMFFMLGFSAYRVCLIGRMSVKTHQSAAPMLYSDPKVLNKWGFLYVHFRAQMYYFILVVLTYILIKGMFIAFGQKSGTTQSVALLIIEAAFLVAVSVLKPYMDKKTNAFNIAIAAMNFLNALLLLFFTGVFDLPALGIAVIGVLFFVFNALFTLVILIMVIWAASWAIFSKNPDTRYQPMGDDRGSFIKSQADLHQTELDALGVTARGGSRAGGYTSAIENEKGMMSSDLNGSGVRSSVRSSVTQSRDSFRNMTPVQRPEYVESPLRGSFDRPRTPRSVRSTQK